MPISCQSIINVLEKIAPCKLAEQWDNCGLLIGSRTQLIHKVLLCLDITKDTVDEAINVGADMIVSHHPLIFGSLKSIVSDEYMGNVIASLIRNNIVVYAAHTCLDAAVGGVNDILAARLGLHDICILDVTSSEVLYKLAVYVPISHAQVVSEAMADKGAGHIGNYSNCSFRTPGVGTFLPLEGTNPYIGKKGELEFVEEYKIETIVPEKKYHDVLKAMLDVHPYEEVAYDVYRLENQGRQAGIGRIGKLAEECSLGEFAVQVKSVLNADVIRYAGMKDKRISTVAVCGGSGIYLIDKAVNCGADVLVTADIKYHDAQKAVERGIAVIDAGHFATERPVLDALKKYIDENLVTESFNIEVYVTKTDKDVFRYV